MLRHWRFYKDAWLTPLSARNTRQRLCLDMFTCLSMAGMAMHLYGQRIDQHTCFTDLHSAADLLEGASLQPCSVPRTLLRVSSRVLNVKSSLTALARDTQPGGSMPNELVLLAIYASAILMICIIVIAPCFWLQYRSYILMLTSVLANSVCMSSLILHPDSAPSQHWRTFLPSAGAGLVWKQIMLRVRDWRIRSNARPQN